MEKDSKSNVGLLNTCHGCLSSDRIITPLGEHTDMLVNMLGVHRNCLVYAVMDIKFCWECMAVLKKFKLFQNQVRAAQAGLMKMLYEIDVQVSTLSKLMIVNKNYFDQDIKHRGSKKVKENHKQVENITVIKTEIEDLHPYSDENEIIFTNDDLDTKLEDYDNVDSNFFEEDNLFLDKNGKINSMEIKKDVFNGDHGKVELIDNKTENKLSPADICAMTMPVDDIKIEVTDKPKRQRRHRDLQCVNNVVGYYKRYATLVKSEKKDWGSAQAVRARFNVVQLTEEGMEEHFLIKDRRNTTYKRLPHKCTICVLGYVKELDLKRHNDLNHHKEGAPYKCSQCSKKLSSLVELSEHWRTHSIAYACKACSNVCKESCMRRHLDHAHTKNYECNVCHLRFGTLKLFTLHYKQMHMKFTCDQCNLTLTTKKKMEKHISEHHMEFKCNDCNRSYKSYIYYKKHCYSLHPEKLKPDNNPELAFCVECNKQFPSVDKYKTHLRVSTKHNKKKQIALPCPDCGRVFNRKKNLNYHYNLFHLKKTKYYCELCDKYFARPAGLRTHRQNVHLKVEKVKDKICDLCGRGFASQTILRHHRRTHTGERPHKCPHCTAEFIQKYAMQTHVRTQHKEFAKDIVPKDNLQFRDVKKVPVMPAWPDPGYFV